MIVDPHHLIGMQLAIEPISQQCICCTITATYYQVPQDSAGDLNQTVELATVRVQTLPGQEANHRPLGQFRAGRTCGRTTDIPAAAESRYRCARQAVQQHLLAGAVIDTVRGPLLLGHQRIRAECIERQWALELLARSKVTKCSPLFGAPPFQILVGKLLRIRTANIVGNLLARGKYRPCRTAACGGGALLRAQPDPGRARWLRSGCPATCGYHPWCWSD